MCGGIVLHTQNDFNLEFSETISDLVSHATQLADQSCAVHPSRGGAQGGHVGIKGLELLPAPLQIYSVNSHRSLAIPRKPVRSKANGTLRTGGYETRPTIVLGFGLGDGRVKSRGGAALNPTYELSQPAYIR